MAFKPSPTRRPLGSKPQPKKTGFVYHARTAESIKERAERSGGRFDSPFKNGVDNFRPKVGDNLIRILPPSWEPHDHYAHQIWVHRFIGPDSSTYMCLRKMLNKKCPVCEAEKESRDAGELDEAKQLAAVEQFVCWVVNRDEDEDAPPQLYSMSWTMDRDIAALCHDKRKGKILLIDHPDKGYDVTIKRQGMGMKTKYFGLAIDREATPISDDDKRQEEVLDFIMETPVPSVFKYYSYDHLANVLSGGEEEKDEDLDEDNSNPEIAEKEAEAESENEAEEARQDRRTGKRPITAKRPVHDEEEEPPFDTDEEEEEERPARKPTRKPLREEEEEEQTEDEEEYDHETGEVTEEEDEEEERPTHRPKPVKHRSVRHEEPEDEEEVVEEEEEEERPQPRRAGPKRPAPTQATRPRGITRPRR